MPKVSDIGAYWSDLAKKNGIDEDTAKVVLEALGKDSVRKAFTDGFKPLPDYSHDMDDVRNRTKTETETAINARNQAIYEENLKKYNEYVSVIDKARKYEEIYGALDGQNPNGGGNPMTMTKEELDQFKAEMRTELEQSLSRRDRATLDLMDVREQHMSSFRKPLDVSGFEKAWAEHPEWGGSLKLAYGQYVQPDMDKAKEAEWTAKLAQAREEGIRDGYSKRSIPSDAGNKHFSPMFERNEDVAKLDERGQESHSRNAFFEEMRKQPV